MKCAHFLSLPYSWSFSACSTFLGVVCRVHHCTSFAIPHSPFIKGLAFFTIPVTGGGAVEGPITENTERTFIKKDEGFF